MKVAILSNVTAQVLADMLSGEFDVWTSVSFDTWFQDSLSPPEELKAFAPDRILLLVDGRHCASGASVARAAEALAGHFPKAVVAAPDLKALADDMGESFYDERMWAFAKMPWSKAALEELMKFARPKKIAAIDFDGVLWRGVIGEDGVAGVTMNVDFQRRLKALKERGIVLIGLTKNNPCDIALVWKSARMALEEGDFVRIAAGWEEKSVNLAAAARELNLSLDSVVFFDDSPVERAKMRSACPEVCVAPFPFADMDAYFPGGGSSREDASRTEFYKADLERRKLADALSLERYFAELKIRVRPLDLGASDAARLAQLSQKTNQFNINPKRYSQSQVLSFLEDKTRKIFAFSAEDKFGDYGTISFVNYKIDGDEAFCEDFVMSCRAMGRTIEFAIEEFAERSLAAAGIKKINAIWKRTGRNEPVRKLFESFGFSLECDSGDEKRYSVSLPRSAAFAKRCSL
jgi:FkbH-like protein